MKNIIISLVLSATSLTTFASEFQPGSFNLYSKAQVPPNANCDIGTSLTLDRSEIKGNVAFLSNFVNGICEIHIEPNPRYYKISSVDKDGCGGLIYKGSLRTNEGKRTIEIIDYRNYRCEIPVLANIIVHEQTTQGVQTLYSFDDEIK